MEKDYERVKEIEYQMQKFEEAYAKECIEVYNQKGFDIYKSKWERKINKIAKKYADILSPLRVEHDFLREQLNEQEEIERKRKYTDIGI